jgi:beta-galactosidase
MEDFYAGRPALTRNRYGIGIAYYAGTLPDPTWLRSWISSICTEQGIEPVVKADQDVEAGLRTGVGGASTLLLINHTNKAAQIDLLGKRGRSLLDEGIVSGNVTLDPHGVLVMELEP